MAKRKPSKFCGDEAEMKAIFDNMDAKIARKNSEKEANKKAEAVADVLGHQLSPAEIDQILDNGVE